MHERALSLILMLSSISLICRGDGCAMADFSFSFNGSTCTGNFTFTGWADCGVGTINSVWTWDFGDGSSQVYDIMNPVHQYVDEGTYTVTLWILPLCHGPGIPPCISTQTINVVFPVINQFVPTVISNYDGYNVSCPGNCDGIISVYSVQPFYIVGLGDFSEGNVTIDGVCAGTYQVNYVPPGACGFHTKVITVTEPPPLSAVIDTEVQITSDYNGSAISCFDSHDGMLEVVVTDGEWDLTDYYSYQWYVIPDGCSDVLCWNAIEGATEAEFNSAGSGIYAVRISDVHNCSTYDYQIVSGPDELVAEVTVQDEYEDGTLGQASTTITGGTAPYSILWSNGAAGTDTIEGLTSGAYSVVVEDANGCWVETLFDISFVLRIGETTDPVFFLQSNPGNGGVQLITPAWSKGMEYYVVDGIGRLVKSGRVTSMSTFMDTGDMADGLYMVTVFSREEKLTKKLLLLSE